MSARLRKAWVSCGTNTPAIATVLNYLSEYFEIDDFLLIVTHSSERFATKAKELSKSLYDKLKFDVYRLGNSDVEVLMKYNNHLNWLRAKATDGMILDITGGLKVMPVLMVEAASSVNYKKTYVMSPGMYVSGWWLSEVDLSFYPLVPKAHSQLLLIGENRPKPKRSFRLPQVIEVFNAWETISNFFNLKKLDQNENLSVSKASKYLKAPASLLIWLLNFVGDKEYSLEIEFEGMRANLKVTLNDNYMIDSINEFRIKSIDKVFDKRIWRCNRHLKRCGTKYEVVNDLDQALGFVGLRTFKIEEIFDPDPEVEGSMKELEGKNVKELFKYIMERGGSKYLVMDTDLAYSGIHNEVFEFILARRITGDRRIDVNTFRENVAGFHECSKVEVLPWTTEVKRPCLNMYLSHAIDAVVELLEAPLSPSTESLIPEPVEGKRKGTKGICDTVFLYSKFSYQTHYKKIIRLVLDETCSRS